MPEKNGAPARGRSIYLLPNLFTLTALFAGFYAIVSGMRGHFDEAAIAIFVAIIMDSLDGRLARLTNTQTAFGAELDSLADMVSFGVAPALVAYSWSLSYLGKIGWLVAFVFAVAVALRLARFNIAGSQASKRYFKGLPCPPGAGLLASVIWLGERQGVNGVEISWLIAALTVIIGSLMVSNINYRSFKDWDLKGSVPFVGILAIVLVFVLVAMDPPQVLLIVGSIYALSGPVCWLWQRSWGKKGKDAEAGKEKAKGQTDAEGSEG